MPPQPCRRNSIPMRFTVNSAFPRAIQLLLIFVVRMTCLCLLCDNSQAANQWTDISSAFVQRLTNNGAAAPWPGGCSGVVVNRTNGDVTVKIVGLGLWRS